MVYSRTTGTTGHRTAHPTPKRRFQQSNELMDSNQY